MKLTKNSGFTLIEMIVVVTIVAMIATLSVANFRAGQKQKQVVIASDTVTSILRAAQNYTLTSKQIMASTCNQGKRPQSYLVVFVSGSTNGILLGIDKCNTANLIQTFSLPVGTKVSSFRVDNSASSNLQVKFDLPFAATTVSSNASINTGPFNSFATATVTVTLDDGSLPRTVTVDGVAGRIGE